MQGCNACNKQSQRMLHQVRYSQAQLRCDELDVAFTNEQQQA